MSDELGVFEAMYTMRAMRRLRPDPVPDEVVRELLDAAIRAPSGQNTQRWAFVVLREDGSRRFFGERYRHWIHTLMGDQMPAAVVENVVYDGRGQSVLDAVILA